MEARYGKHGSLKIIARTVVAALLFLSIPFSVYLTCAYPGDAFIGWGLFPGYIFNLTEMDALKEFHVDTLA